MFTIKKERNTYHVRYNSMMYISFSLQGAFKKINELYNA